MAVPAELKKSLPAARAEAATSGRVGKIADRRVSARIQIAAVAVEFGTNGETAGWR